MRQTPKIYNHNKILKCLLIYLWIKLIDCIVINRNRIRKGIKKRIVRKAYKYRNKDWRKSWRCYWSRRDLRDSFLRSWRKIIWEECKELKRGMKRRISLRKMIRKQNNDIIFFNIWLCECVDVNRNKIINNH